MTAPTDPRGEPTRAGEHHVATDITVTSEPPDQALERHIAHEQTEALLDEASSETLSASDPVAITSRKHGSM